MRLLAAAPLMFIVAPLEAQTGNATFSGRVLTDSVRTPVVNAAVAIRSLNKSTSTDDQGRFQFAGIKPGTYEVAVRRLGYSPYNERIAVRAGEAADHEILLVRATVLDSITVTASAIIPSFEENRAIGLGRFFDRSDLGKQEGRRLSEVIAQVQGVKVIPGQSGYAWLASRRGVTSVNNKTCTGRRTRDEVFGLDVNDARMGAKNCECYALVYVDKQLMYRGSQVSGEPLFNLNSIPVDQIEAIEFYAGPAQTPMEYSRLNSQCGVLVIHTRRSK